MTLTCHAITPSAGLRTRNNSGNKLKVRQGFSPHAPQSSGISCCGCSSSSSSSSCCGGGGCCCCFLEEFLLLCIHTLSTCLLTPTSLQNCCTAASSCFCILHPTVSAKANMLSFCSAVNLVRNLFLDAMNCCGGAPAISSSLDDSVAAPTLAPALFPACSRRPDGFRA